MIHYLCFGTLYLLYIYVYRLLKNRESKGKYNQIVVNIDTW